MGLPVLTCVGDTFASRVAGSLINTAGLTELVTYTLQDYENKALWLTENPQWLEATTQKLITERLTSALFDTEKFAAALEAVYKNIWLKHLEKTQTS
jgi:predicted O-linked N-acetylglucosamine transferase (SPINDLY family)